MHGYRRICCTHKTMRCISGWMTSVVCHTGACSEPYYSWSKRLPFIFLWLCYEYEMSIRNHFMELASQSLIDDLRDMCVCKHILYNYVYTIFIHSGEVRIWKCQKLLMKMLKFKTSISYRLQDDYTVQIIHIRIWCIYIIIQCLYDHYTSLYIIINPTKSSTRP